MEKNITSKTETSRNRVNNRLPLLIFVALVFVVELVYTLMVIKFEGMNFVPVFIHNISQFSWSGQFNLDFSFYLVLSAIWIIWRNGPGVKSFILAIAALAGGTLFFSLYLAYVIIAEKGDLARVVTGERMT
ncbi:MAG: hypothetical protein LWX56_14215 [Ignavibacteria bacterium]|nr:hypothetical protein [Ignavibacteria bacterium]